MDAVLYVHGKGGSADESARFRHLFPEHRVLGLDFKTFSPWETGAEIRRAVEDLKKEYQNITLIASSIGAYFCMCADIDKLLSQAFFISPVVDMEALIRGMMAAENVTETELENRGAIPTAAGEELSWDYLQWVIAHPVRWTAPTEILYGARDVLIPYDAVAAFARSHHAELTVMKDGEHWFHTPEQLRFLDSWIFSAHKSVF